MNSRFYKTSVERAMSEDDIREIVGDREVARLYIHEHGPAIAVDEQFCEYFRHVDAKTQAGVIEDFVAGLRDVFARIMNDSKAPH